MRIRGRVCVAAALAFCAAALPAVSGRADSGTPPSFVRTIGGPGHATIYPSGVEIDPVDGAYVVADTGNDHVKKFDASGSLVWDVGGFGASTSPLRFNDPRDIGIDSTGAVYVADTANVRIVKLDGATGGFVTSWKGPANDKIGSPIGLTVSLTDDQVYVADAGKKKVRVFDHTGNQVNAFGEDLVGGCAFSSIRDVDAGPSGNVYVANYLKNDILKMSSSGICLGSWGTKGLGSGQFKNPYGVRVAPDPAIGTAVFVADSNNERVQEFTTSGAYVAQFGTTGSASNQFGGLRRVAVGPAAACGPNVCVTVAGADLWGWKLGVWSGNGTLGYSAVGTVPSPVVPPPGDGGTSLTDPPTSVFNEARAVAFDAGGDLRVMDTVNQRIVWLQPDGSLPSGTGTWTTCGKRGWTAGAFNWPRGIAVDTSTGNLWVADTKQSRLQVISASCGSPAFIGKAGSGSTNFNWPYSVAIRQSDRIAFVADTKNNRIDAYDVATKSLLANYGTKGTGAGQFQLPSAVSVDPVSGHVFVADRNNDRIVELSFNGSSFSWVGTFGGTGTLKRPEGVAVDATRVYVADTGNNRLVVLQRPGGAVLATVTGMLTPQDVAVDANDCVYVSDTYHDVIKVYSYGGCP